MCFKKTKIEVTKPVFVIQTKIRKLPIHSLIRLDYISHPILNRRVVNTLNQTRIMRFW